MVLRRLAAPEEIEALWDIALPITSYSLLVFSAAAWALKKLGGDPVQSEP